MEIPFFKKSQSTPIMKFLFGEKSESGAVANASKQMAFGGDVMQKYSTYFTDRTMSPGTIQSAMDAYRSDGRLQFLGNIMELLLDSDDNLQSKILVRKSPIKRAVWSYGAKLPKERQKFYDGLIKKQLSDWVDTFLEGKLMGYQFQQVMWEFDGALYTPTELVTYTNLDLRVVRRKLYLYENDRPVELDDYKFLSVLYKRPTLHTLLKYYVFYIYALNNWAQFVETYGKPPRIGKYDSFATPAEMDVLKKAVRGLGTDQAAIISKDMEIELKDFGGKYGSQSLYKTLCDFVTSRVTNAILGQPLTTEPGEHGARSLGEVQDQVQDDIIESDLTDFSRYVNTLLGYVDAVNFGGSGVDVYFEVFKPVNLQQRIVIDTALVNMGLPIAQDYFYDTYNVDKPKPGQEVVRAGAGVYQEEQVNAEGNRNVPAAPMGLDSRLRGNDGEREGGLESVCAERDKEGTLESACTESACTETACTDVIVNSEGLDGFAKTLSQISAEIRACETLKDLKAINYGAFVRDMGNELAKSIVQKYVDGRKSARQKGRKANSILPEIRFEWDESSIGTVNAFRAQAHIISRVRTGQAFKQLWEDAARILEEGGDFKEFIAKADLAGFAPDNPYHLRTEFDTAIASAEASGRWAEIEADADLFPYLRYVTMGDNLVREEHSVLEGTIAAVNDEFWEENYPPNGYNCRCSVEQVTESEARADSKFNEGKPTMTKDENFSQNVGKTDSLPSDAFEKLWEFAERAIDSLPNSEGLRAQMAQMQGTSDTNAEAFDKKALAFDVNGYPVNMGASASNELAISAIAEPTEIWHNGKFESSYIKRMEDKVVLAVTETGKLNYLWELDRYEDQGRYGVMEYGQI